MLADSRTADLVALTRTVRELLSPDSLAIASLVVGVAAWVVDRRPRALVLLLVALGGAVLLAQTVEAVVERSRAIPTLDGFATSTFPSGRMTVVGAFAIAILTVVLPRIRRWTRKVGVATVVLGVVLLGGLAVLFLGEVYLSDVLGGVTLGAVWGLAVATAVTTVWRPPPPRRVEVVATTDDVVPPLESRR